MSKLTYVQKADLLEAAAKLIEDKGWCRNTELDGRGHHCTLGAIQEVVSGSAFTVTDLSRELAGAVCETIRSNNPGVLFPTPGTRCVTQFNDNLTDKSGKRTVIRLLLKAAAEVRKKGRPKAKAA